MIVDILKMFYKTGIYNSSNLNEFVKCGKITKDDLEYIMKKEEPTDEIIESMEEEVEF